MNSSDQYRVVAEAFSRQSSHYDQDERANKILQIMRRQVRTEVENAIDPGKHILELNAGTGIDAMYFADKGFSVTATDLSPGMIEQIEQKVEEHGMQERLHVVQCAFHELGSKLEGKYDFVFSNMGGLNCEKDLYKVFQQLTPLMNNRAKAIIVIMPKNCPWEWLSVFKGKWKHAFRRWQVNGATAHLEGMHFTTFYHSLSSVKDSLPKGWEIIKSTGLAATIPQPHSTTFPDQHPLLFKVLNFIDQRLRKFYPFNRWADHIIVELQYNAG